MWTIEGLLFNGTVFFQRRLRMMGEQLNLFVVNLLKRHSATNRPTGHLEVVISSHRLIDTAEVQLLDFRSALCQIAIGCVEPLQVESIVEADCCYLFLFAF